MANLPPARSDTSPPFTNVGLDVFGPWKIATRRLRGGTANAKRWSLIFTCLSSRAIHLEVLETLEASSFICALRRFLAIPGLVKKLRCDQGTNFVGGKSQLDGDLQKWTNHVSKDLRRSKVANGYLIRHSRHISEGCGSVKSLQSDAYWTQCSWRLDTNS